VSDTDNKQPEMELNFRSGIGKGVIGMCSVYGFRQQLTIQHLVLVFSSRLPV